MVIWGFRNDRLKREVVGEGSRVAICIVDTGYGQSGHRFQGVSRVLHIMIFFAFSSGRDLFDLRDVPNFQYWYISLN